MNITPITFCITVANNEKYYTLGLLDSLVKNTQFNKHEVLLLIDTDNQNTYEALLEYKKDKPNIRIHKNESGYRIGYQKNISILFGNSLNDIVVYLQSDMVVSPEFDRYFLEALGEDTNKVITLARIEPPIHPPSPEKITKSFGLTPNEFEYDNFINFSKELIAEDRPMIWGHFAPFGLYKKTYFDRLGGLDSSFRCSREDSDFIIRLGACKLDPLETWNANVYHYTCVSSRGEGWYEKDNKQVEITNSWQIQADQEELKRFIRKWGYFGHDYKPKYKTTLFLNIDTAPNLNLLSAIEPYFDKIITNQEQVKDQLYNLVEFNSQFYTNKRWNYTQEDWDKLKHTFMGSDLSEKFSYSKTLPKDISNEDVFVEIDMYSLLDSSTNQVLMESIKNLNLSLSQLSTQPLDKYKGQYNMGNLKLTINNLVDINQSHLDNKQYLFDTSTFIFK